LCVKQSGDEPRCYAIGEIRLFSAEKVDRLLPVEVADGLTREESDLVTILQRGGQVERSGEVGHDRRDLELGVILTPSPSVQN
jgi:hypothetical protein